MSRFAERHPEVDELTEQDARSAFLAELEHSTVFGGQLGSDELRLLPCGLVAAVAWKDGVGSAKTVLTREQAIANMEARGTTLRASDHITRLLESPPTEPRAETLNEPQRLQLRSLAATHVRSGVGRKRRNQILREMGYDSAGPAGDFYRASFREAQETLYAERRAQFAQLTAAARIDKTSSSHAAPTAADVDR
jgi:hypothetical protein